MITAYKRPIPIREPLPADHEPMPNVRRQTWTTHMNADDKRALARKVEQFIAENDPFGDRFSTYELGCVGELIEGP